MRGPARTTVTRMTDNPAPAIDLLVEFAKGHQRTEALTARLLRELADGTLTLSFDPPPDHTGKAISPATLHMIADKLDG